MSVPTRSRPQLVTVLCIAAAASIVAFVGWTLYSTVQAANRASTRVLHSHEVLRTMGTFRESFATIAAAQRGYLLEGDARMLGEREDAIARAEGALAELRRLTADNPLQWERVAQLSATLAERAASVRALTDHVRVPLRERAVTPVEAAARRRLTAQAMRLADDFDTEETRLLAERQALELRRQRQSSLVLALEFVTFTTMLLLAFGGVFFSARLRHRAQRQMEEIVEGLPVTVWQMKTGPDGKRRFIYVASGASRERGVPAPDLLRDSSIAVETVLEEDRQRLVDALDLSEQTLAPLDCSYRMARRNPGDAPRWVHKHARLRRLPDGTVLWTGYWADITPEKQLEQALRDATDAAHSASRAKTSFLATMSHEIRTPMTGVLGLLELLSLTSLDSEQRATLRVIRESSRSLLRIIDDILDFSKVEEGRLALAPVPASLRDTVRRACDVHSGIASGRGLLLEQRIDPRVCEAHLFDPVRMGQILNNFISNAVKFTERGGVQVAVELLDDKVTTQRLRLSVTDTGIGVPQERIAQLFRPFEQGAPQIASTYGGTGLGLAICRRIAELMGGSVSMQSEVGHGTRMVFDVEFPVADPAQLQEQRSQLAERRAHAVVTGRRAAPTPQAAEEQGTLVLVVDDHPTNRMVLSRQVTSLGYWALVAADGVEALGLWESRAIGLVLTDSNMPNMNGYELARAIRQREALEGRPRVPILGCTANALDGESERCAAAGMDGCLIKPLDLATLMENLQRWLPVESDGEPVPQRPQAASPREPQDSKFDSELLALVSGGVQEEERQFLRAFVNANAEDLDQLQRAVHAYDTREVARLAHRIMGAAQTLGATALLRACRALEENALVEEPKTTLLSDLRDVLARSNELEQRLHARIAGDDLPPLAGAPTPWIR